MMDISFTNPAGFWALLALPAVLAIHFLQRESRRVVTSTLFLFEQLAPVSAEGRRFERLRNSLPLWLQIAAVGLLTWLLVGPRWVRRESTQRIVVVLDSSVSMLPFRADALRALGARLPRLANAAGTTEWRVLETDTTRPTLYAGNETRAALDALARWQPRLGTHDFAPALRTAQSLARGTGLALFVTDRHADLPDGVALLAVGRPLDNCGFAGLSVEDNVWHALVKNYAGTVQTRSWHLEAAGAASAPQTLTLEPGQTRTLSGPFPAAQDRCELVLAGDDFPLDDRLPIVRPQPKALTVAGQPGTPLDAFLTRFAASIPDASPAPTTGADVRLAVNDPAAAGPALVFSTQTAPTTDFLTGDIVAETHPLTAGLAWNGLLVRDTPPLPRQPDDEVLLWQGERPLIFLRGGSPHRSLFINFDLLQSNADRLPAFVVLLNRFVETVRDEKVAPERLNVETDARLALASNPAGGPLLNSGGGCALARAGEPRLIIVSQDNHPLLTGCGLFGDPREPTSATPPARDTHPAKFAPLTERHRRADFSPRCGPCCSASPACGTGWPPQPCSRLKIDASPTMIRFAAPEWWILAPLLVVAGLVWRRLKLWHPLRFLCLLLLLLVLTQLQLRRLGKGLDLWVLVDRSASAADAMSAHLGEWQTLLERSKGPADRLFYVDYAESPVVRGEGTDANPSELQQTRTRLAIRYALSQMAPDRAARLLTLTDGFSTEPLADVSDRLLAQHVPLDYRLVTSPDATDYGVDRLSLPPRAQPGEPFLVEMDVSGTPDATVPFEVLRDGQRLHTGTVTVQHGRGTTRFADRITAGGAHRYTLRLAAPGDTRMGNNTAEGWIEITGRPRVLLVTDYVNDPAADALRAQGFEVRTVNDLGTLNVGDLSGARAVLLNNVPAYKLPSDFLNGLDLYVRVQGGGLLMAGGKYAFGSGGYAHSKVDDLLPVSMELRTEHRKLAVALAIVMDRSGSMGAGVAGGVTKMDLADEGAARAIDLLGAQDAASVIAVDTEPHVIVPLTKLGNDRKELTDTVRRIASEGGGIFIFNGLKGGWAELQKSTAGQRHLLLFADASDSVQPEGYEALVDEMVKAGVTISVIGMGSDADKDAGLLKDIAARGKGQVFFDADPATLPALFEQETVAMARSAFLDEPVAVKPAAGWLELAAKPLAWPAAVDGYNLSYLKPDATAAVYSADEYAAPLLAFWQRGLGRTAAVSFPLGGEYSARVRAWGQYGDFLQTLTRWLMGDELPPGLALRPRVDGTDLGLDLFYDQSWEERLAANAPTVILADGATGQPRPVVWEHLEPGHFKAAAPLPPGQWVRGAVQLGPFAVPFGPLAAGINPEWTLDHARVAELGNVARLSGGGERTDLAKVWDAPRQAEFRDLRPPLLLAFLLAFLADALATRLGWQLPGVRRMALRRPASPTVRPVRRPAPAMAAAKPSTPPAPVRAAASPPVPVTDREREARSSRFRKAKSVGADDPAP